MKCTAPSEGWNFEAFENRVFGKAIFISYSDRKWRVRVLRYLCRSDLRISNLSCVSES